MAKGQKERQTRRKPLSRLTPHAYKATQATQSTRTTQTHTKRPKPAKNALKTRNRAIFKDNTPKTKRENGQKEGTHGQRTNASTRVSPEHQKAYIHTPVDTMNTAKQSRRNLHHLHPHFKNIFRFCPFLSPIFPRLDKIKQINVYFCPVFDLFGLKIRSDGVPEDSLRCRS